MKKLVLLVAIFAISFVHAQELSFGAKAGVSYGGTGTSDAEYAKHFTGVIAPHFGLIADIAISDDFSVQPELLYSTTGFNRNETLSVTSPAGDIDVDYDYQGRLNYLSIPVMAKYYFVDGFSLEAGPYVNFLLSTKISGKVVQHLPEIAGGDTTTDLGSDDAQDDFKKGYKSTDFGLGVGASYELDMGLFFTARYNLGLSDISVDKDDLSDEQVDGVNDNVDTSKPKGLQFSVGYKFM